MENEEMISAKSEAAADLSDPSPEPEGMGEKQAAVALSMIRDGTPIRELLTEFGVSEEEFADWIRAGEFPELVASLARGFAQADAPYIWSTLIREAKDGNVPAIRLYFDIWMKKMPASASHEAPLRDPSVDALRSDLFGL